MKLLSKLSLFCCLFAVLVFTGCQKQSMTTQSEKTGWKYNKPDQGFFNVNTVYHGKCPMGMIYIPVSTAVRGQNSEMMSIPENNAKKRVAASGFYMDEYEVTNLNWREYIAWLEGVYAHDLTKVVRALPDESVWRKELAYNEPFVRDYFTHVAYGFYPVVGVSWRQAVAYCEWRTDRLNENELILRGVIPYKPLTLINEQIRNDKPDSARKYFFTTKYARDYVTYTNMNADDLGDVYFDPDYRYDLNGDDEISADEWKIALDGVLYDAEIRLPTETEWEYAAYGLETYRGMYQQTNTYPWAGDQMRELDDKDKRGDFYANFLRGRGDPIGVQLNGTLTVPVTFFQPNGFGLYNMAGNVNEWVKDVYRANTNFVDEVNSFRGNEFESDSLYAENVLTKHFAGLTPQVRDSMRKVLINERGITKTGGDYRDFKDGDKQSSINDSVLVYKDLTPIEKASLYSNTARVYKGGGWNDRSIWLNPSNRRALEETRCRNDLGFRCVMSTVGGNEHSREYYYKDK